MRFKNLVTLNIANAATTTEAFGTHEFRNGLAVRPATGTEGSVITFLGSSTIGGTYSAVNIDGTDISITLTAAEWDGPTEQEARVLLSIPFLKLVAGTAQTGATTVEVALS